MNLELMGISQVPFLAAVPPFQLLLLLKEKQVFSQSSRLHLIID